jgi:long-chain acyl-CoA synthetase
VPDLRPDATPTGVSRPWLQHYDEGVPAGIEIEDRSFAELLDRAAERWPGSPALRHLGRELSYRELRHDVEQFSTALARLGVGQGDRVGLVLPNCPQYVVALFGVLRLGAVAVPIPPDRPALQVAAALRDADAQVVICVDRALDAVAALRDDPTAPVREVVVTLTTDYLPALERIALAVPSRIGRRERARASGSVPPGAGLRLWSEELRRARGLPVPAPRPAEITPSADAAVVIYPPAPPGQVAVVGLVWTSRNLRAAGAQAAAWLTNARLGRESVLVGMPLCTVEGLTLCIAAGTMLGAALQLTAGTTGEVGAAADREVRPTVAVGPPEFLESLIGTDAEQTDMDLRSLRLCVTGPQLLDPARAARLSEASGAAVVDGVSVPGAPVLLGRPVRGSLSAGTCLPLPSTEVRVVDAAGVPLPVGRPGRLEVRGPQVFAGLWRRPAETAAVLRDGWLVTELTGCLHPDGRVELT